MSAITDNPVETNFLPVNNFRLLLRRAPNLQFFLQKANLPGVSAMPIEVPNQFVTLPMISDKLIYSPLEVTFKVTENLLNYLEVYNWLAAITHTTDFTEYGKLAQQPSWSNQSIKSDIVLTIQNSSKVASFEIVFHDAFPTSLGGIVFESDASSSEYATVTATFAYQYFEIESLSAAFNDPNDVVNQ